MVAIDNSDVLNTNILGRGRFPDRLHISLAGIAAIACALTALITMAAGGFDENSLRQGSEMAWRFTFFVFFVALIAGPLAHLLPFAPMRGFGKYQRQLLWGFCASFAVYLATLLVPNTIRPVSLSHDGLTAGMTLFVAFSAVQVAVIAYAISHHAVVFLGEKARRAILTVGTGYFWVAYALGGLAHISGPHRPDSFYGLSLSLMVAALLLRFAERLIEKINGARAA